MGRYNRKIKIILENTTPISWNKFYRAHWTVQRKLKADFERLIWAYIPREARGLKIKDCVIEIYAYFKSSKKGSKYYWIDSDNLCSKPIVDALKLNVVKEDDPRYVKMVSTASRLDEENPRTEIIIKYIDN